VALVGLGLALLALEAFVIPGFGIAGIFGIVAFAAGLFFSLLGGEIVTNADLVRAASTVALTLLLLMIGGIALAWLLTRPGVSCLVVGGRNEAQFLDNFGAVDLALTPDDLDRLNRVSRVPLIYPYWHQNNFAEPRFSDADRVLHDSYKDA